MVDASVYAEFRPLVFAIAYRMLGSASEAEDIVQESFLRLHSALDEGEVRAPKAYLATVATRLSIDRLRSARTRREQYVGTWLPEPLIVDEELEAIAEADTADSLSLAFLVLLESLTPVERAVFLLRDVFDYDYAEIADVVVSARTTCARSRPARDGTWKSADPGSRARGRSETGLPSASSRQPRKRTARR